MGKFEEASTISLISRFVALVKLFFAKEKIQIQQVAGDAKKISVPALVLGVAGLVFLLIAGIYFLVSVVLILNIWFLPWASGLIAAGIFLLMGVIFALSAVKLAKKGIGEAKINVSRIKEDLKWLKKS